MEAPSGSSLVAPPPSPVDETPVLPGLEPLPRPRRAPEEVLEPDSSDDASRISAMAARIEDLAADTTLDGAVSALEEIRRLESWLAWSKHRVASAAVRAAEAEQERWLATASLDTFDDGSHSGLTRRERLAVGERSGIAEVACALHVSEGAAHALVTRADHLTGYLPRTAAALRSGAISATAGMLIADAAREYADDLPSAADEATVDRLTTAIDVTETGLLHAATGGRTKAELEARARRLRERCHPSSFAQREQEARADRYVRVSPDRDGMARLSALLPAAVAWRIDGRLSTMARLLAEAPAASAQDVGGRVDDTMPSRTITQLRADVLADLLTGLVTRSVGDAAPNGASTRAEHPDEAGSRAVAASGEAGRAAATGDPVPQVLLTMPADTLLGGDEPGWLGAFGPIAAADARDLARHATSFMLGVTGHASVHASDDAGLVARVVPVLATKGDHYRIPAAVRRALAVRDGTCRFPGCRRSAARCDVDHVIAWADGGASEPSNLAHLCRKHHVLKHHSTWSVSAGPPGNASGGSPPDAGARLIWTSPSGRGYTTDPDDPPPF